MGRHGENIRQRSDGRWEGRYKVFNEDKGRFVYRSVYSRGYGEIKEKLSKARLGLIEQDEKEQIQETNSRSKKGNKTSLAVQLSQIAGEWLEEVAKRRKHSTYIKYKTVYQNHIANLAASCQLSASAINFAAVMDLQEKIFDHISREALSESLQNSIYCMMKQILTFACKKYSISLNLSLLEKRPVKAKKKAVSSLSKAEQTKIFSVLCHKRDKFKIAVLLCLYTGMRLGELCALQWTDIDEDNMTLTINRTVQRIAVQGHVSRTILMETTPKSESSKRTIPLSAEMMELLAQLKCIQRKESQTYVFGGKHPLEPRTMQYRFKKILKEAGMSSKNFHILRHTFATNCIETCMDAKALSEILGHSDVKITLNRYVHPTMDLKRKQIGKLPNFYGQICGQAG